MTRTRPAETATDDSTPAPAPVKKTAAKKAPARKATGRKTTAASRPARPRARKATAPALSLVKEQHDKATEPPAPTATVVDLRYALPVRRRRFVGTHTKAQIIEARAALASATAQLPIPHILWLAQIDGRAAARLADGTHLIHTHERAPEFTAILRCPTGGLHTELVTNERDLKAARAITATCTRRHDDTDPGAGTYDWHKATTLGIQKLIPARLSVLNVGLQAAKKATAETQPMSEKEIADGLAARAAAADDETPKEHPEL